MKSVNTVIIGAGLSGLYTALLIDRNKSIVILVKDTLSESNSWLAQGGIAAEMNHEKEVLKRHMQDTVTAGSNINNPRAVKTLVHEAQANIEQLMMFNVAFDRDVKGNLKTTREGGHSVSRVLHSGGDATGRDIMEALRLQAVHRANIEIIEETMAYDFITHRNSVIGIKTLDKKHLTTMIFAENIVLATGGIGAVYSHTTNAKVATGDGIALAIAHGITVEKMAFIQFHPTALYKTSQRTHQNFLISEALRGEGAILRNINGEAFMKKYHPSGDLAPRDIVSQAIYREMYDTWSAYAYLDTTHLDKEYLTHRFPTITKHLALHGYTLAEDLIPITPVQHFIIGGVKTNLNGQTAKPHIYAVGENASTGAHGANRLASNSLLECVVYGKRIANHINVKTPRNIKITDKEPVIPSYNYDYSPVRKKLGAIMGEHVGVVRSKKGLENAQELVKELHETLKRYPNHTIRYYETRNMMAVAENIIEDALARKESVGCHYRLN